MKNTSQLDDDESDEPKHDESLVHFDGYHTKRERGWVSMWIAKK